MTDTAYITIRRAVPTDAASISELLHGIGYLKYINEETISETTARIKDSIVALSQSSDDVLIVATTENANTILGYGAAHFYANLLIGNEGYISELYLRSSATNQGIGSKLLITLIDEGRARNCKRLRLTNWRTRESYHRSFYAKQGWQENSEAAEFVYFL